MPGAFNLAHTELGNILCRFIYIFAIAIGLGSVSQTVKCKIIMVQ